MASRITSHLRAQIRGFIHQRPRLQVSLQLLAWAPVAYFCTQHIASVIAIEGRSMQPTFNPEDSMLHEDVVLVNRWAKVTNDFKLGDVVTFWAPGVTRPTLVTKRIVALEGDIVRTLPPWKDKTVRIPPGHCWVEGDEPVRSRDSNTFGALPMGLINGRIDAILYPHWRVRRVDRMIPDHAEKRMIHQRTNIR